jgi:hypothetical protein
MARVTVQWGTDEQAIVTSADELDAILDAVAAQSRASETSQDVQLEADDAGTLGIVVGAERSFLNYIPAQLDPPYRASVGDEDQDRPFTFHVAGEHHSERRGVRRCPLKRPERQLATSSPPAS